MMWTKRFLAFLVISIYLIYLIVSRMLNIITLESQQNRLPSNILFLLFMIFLFTFLIILQIIFIFQKNNKKVPKVFTFILANIQNFLRVLYLESNNFLNHSVVLYRFLNKLSANLVFKVSTMNIKILFIITMVIPFLLTSITFCLEILFLQKLYIFYYAITTLIIPLCIKYLMYRANQIYLIDLLDLQKKAIFQIAQKDAELYTVTSAQNIIEILANFKQGNIKISIEPSLIYIKILKESKINLHIVVKDLLERTQQMVKFRRVLLEYANLQNKYRIITSFFPCIFYLIGWCLLYTYTLFH